MQPERQSIVKTFHDQGVACVRSLFDEQRMSEIRQSLDRYSTQIVPTLAPADVVFEADGQSIRNLWRMEKIDPFFAQLGNDPKLLALVSELVHGKPVLMMVETFNKPARIGSGIPPHQDNAYFCYGEPADSLTVWVAMDEVTQANGPVFYVPGSHKQGMKPHKPSGVKGNSMGLAAPFDKDNVITNTLKPGDALIHHCQTIHFSAPNRTDHPRCGLLMVYRGEHVTQDPALKAEYAKGGAIPA